MPLRFLEGRIERQPWQKWAKLSKLKPAVNDEPKFQGLKAAASAFVRHPRLLAQVDAYVGAAFSCATAATLAYEVHKRSWGLVDFGDQERLALELLGKPELEQQLRERLQTMFVDEFQDTSPLQLAVFVAMSRLAGSSVWVGELEQQIAAFADHYNHGRYHESLDNLTPADVNFGRGDAILLKREKIKRQTMQNRRLQHHAQAA